MVLMSNISAYSNDVVVHSQIHTHTKAHWTHSSFSVYMYSLSTWNMHTFRRSFQRFIRFEYAMNQFDFNKLNTKWYSIFKLENCVLSNPLKFALLERIFSVKLTSLNSKFCRPYSSKPNFPECTFKWTFRLIHQLCFKYVTYSFERGDCELYLLILNKVDRIDFIFLKIPNSTKTNFNKKNSNFFFVYLNFSIWFNLHFFCIFSFLHCAVYFIYCLKYSW